MWDTWFHDDINEPSRYIIHAIRETITCCNNVTIRNMHDISVKSGRDTIYCVAYRKIESNSGASGAGKQQQQQEEEQIQLGGDAWRGPDGQDVFRVFRATCNVRKTVTSLNHGLPWPSRLITTGANRKPCLGNLFPPYFYFRLGRYGSRNAIFWPINCLVLLRGGPLSCFWGPANRHNTTSGRWKPEVKTGSSYK